MRRDSRKTKGILIWELKESLKEWKVVLASASQEEKRTLEQIGIIPDIPSSAVEEEKMRKNKSKLVENLSYIKARCGFKMWRAGTLSATVCCMPEGEERPCDPWKPGNAENAGNMIRQIQGHVHQVYTGVTVILCQEAGSYAGSTFF